MDALEKIFGGQARVKLMRLFLFNPSESFQTQDAADRSKVDIARARRELNFLSKVRMIKKSTRSNGRASWCLNEKFPYMAEFQRLLLQTTLVNTKAIVKKLAKIGKLKVIVFAGIFKEQWDNRLDLMVVAEGAKKGAIDGAISSIEADIGKEIRYAVLDSEDFKYRLGIGDKLIRDIVDYPHEVVLDKFNLLS